MLRGLGYRESDWERPAKELSGGWIMRAHLARLLVLHPTCSCSTSPPTTSTSTRSGGSRSTCVNYEGAVLMISHDREFMDRVADTTLEIDNQVMSLYKGKLQPLPPGTPQALRTTARRLEKPAETDLGDPVLHRPVSQRRLEGLAGAESYQAAGKSRPTVRSRKAPRKVFRIQFPQPERSGQRVITLEQSAFSYPGAEVKVYENLDLFIERGDRIVLIGPNGAGKSTLLKLLAGVLTPTGGSRTEGHNCRIGYFSQHRSETMKGGNTVLQEVLDANPEIREDEARGILGSFLFRKDDVFKKSRSPLGRRKKSPQPGQIPRRPSQPPPHG